jgi:hypothetical protein
VQFSRLEADASDLHRVRSVSEQKTAVLNRPGFSGGSSS